jgi:hypothetical protein
MDGLDPLAGLGLALKKRSRITVQGDRLPLWLRTGLQFEEGTTSLRELEAWTLRLVRDREAFRHRQLRRREGVSND